nr:Ig-like domain-containing protein [Agromyces seonyuensis]
MIDFAPTPVECDVTAGTPVITGSAVVGSTLNANPGTWGPEGVELSTQWLRNGEPIAGAVSTAYTAVAADLGASLSVRVTGTASGYAPTTATSAAVVVQAAPTGADKVKPVASLVTPTVGVTVAGTSVQLRVDATDDRGLNRVTANIYRDGKLFKSTFTAAGGALAATHTATASLPAGDYVVRFNASDLAGNVSTTGNAAFTVAG